MAANRHRIRGSQTVFRGTEILHLKFPEKLHGRISFMVAPGNRTIWYKISVCISDSGSRDFESCPQIHNTKHFLIPYRKKYLNYVLKKAEPVSLRIFSN
jgi:hypothetical protein